MDTKRFEPPAHLSDRAKTIWRAVVPTNTRSVGRLALLQSALEALDLSDKAEAELRAASLTTKTLGSGTIHAHPLVKIQKESRAQFAALWGQLGLAYYGEDTKQFEYWLKQQEAQP